MELTPEQLAALNALPALTKQVEDLKAVSAKVPELETQIKAKDAQIAELQASTKNLTVNSALQGLKTAYPDVPEATLSAAQELPADKRDAILKPIQEKAAQLKVTTVTKSDPTQGWADAGSITPGTEAERAAKHAERNARIAEHTKRGDVMGVLSERSAEIAAHVRRAFVKTS